MNLNASSSSSVDSSGGIGGIYGTASAFAGLCVTPSMFPSPCAIAALCIELGCCDTKIL